MTPLPIDACTWPVALTFAVLAVGACLGVVILACVFVDRLRDLVER